MLLAANKDKYEQLQISVPAMVDLQEFAGLIGLPEAVGWEKALEIADIAYKKYV